MPSGVKTSATQSNGANFQDLQAQSGVQVALAFENLNLAETICMQSARYAMASNKKQLLLVGVAQREHQDAKT